MGCVGGVEGVEQEGDVSAAVLQQLQASWVREQRDEDGPKCRSQLADELVELGELLTLQTLRILLLLLGGLWLLPALLGCVTILLHSVWSLGGWVSW
jgi:hypothetical protein